MGLMDRSIDEACLLLLVLIVFLLGSCVDVRKNQPPSKDDDDCCCCYGDDGGGWDASQAYLVRHDSPQLCQIEEHTYIRMYVAFGYGADGVTVETMQRDKAKTGCTILLYDDLKLCCQIVVVVRR